MLQKRIPTAVLLAIAASTVAAIAVGSKPDGPVAAPSPGVSDREAPPAAARRPVRSVPPDATTSVGPLTMNAQLSHRALQRGRPTTVWARIEVKAGKVEPRVQRPPLDVALVVDRSSSMSDGGVVDLNTGEMTDAKIDTARAAAHQLADEMGPEDRISLATFSDIGTVQHELAQPHDAGLRLAIDRLKASGNTNIAAGYSAGRQTLQFSRANSSKVLFMISDGIATVGTTDPKALAGLASMGLEQSGVSISTLGVGDDFDENTLGAMAVQGGGRFHYVENAEMLGEQLTSTWKNLATAAARDVRLSLVPAKGVVVKRVVGRDWREDGDAVMTMLHTLFSESARHVLVELAVDPDVVGATVLGVSLEYQDLTSDEVPTLHAQAEVGVSIQTDAIRPSDENAAVLGRVRRVLTAQAVDGADQLSVAGNKSGARDLLDEARDFNHAFVRRHGANEDVKNANQQVQRAAESLSQPVQEKRQIRVRKRRKAAMIEIIAGDRK